MPNHYAKKNGTVRLVTWQESGGKFMVREMRELLREPKRLERAVVLLPDERVVIHSASSRYEAIGFVMAAVDALVND